MYEDTYSMFDSDEFEYCKYPTNDIYNDIPTIEWDYGDTLVIPFNVMNQLTYIRDFNDLKFLIKIFNSRGESIKEFEKVPNCECFHDGLFDLEINKEISNKMIKGNYTLQVIAYDDDIQLTLIHPSEYWIHVR